MKFSKVLILGIILSMFAIGCKSEAQEAKQQIIDDSISELKNDTNKASDDDVDFVEGEILVGFKNKADVKSAIAEIEKNEGVTFIDMLMDAKDARIAHFKVPQGEEKAYVTVLSKNKDIEYAELNVKGTFINPIMETQPASPSDAKAAKTNVLQKTTSADKIVGIWEVKNDYYMAVYEIQKYKDKYIGLLHYYNDGKDEVKGDGSKDFYFLDNVAYKNGKYENGKMYMPDGSKYDVVFKLENDNRLEAKMTIQGQPYTETWKRKISK